MVKVVQVVNKLTVTSVPRNPIAINKNAYKITLLNQAPNLVQVNQLANIVKITGNQGLPGKKGDTGDRGARGPSGSTGKNGYRLVTADYYPNFETDGWIDVNCDSGDVFIYLPVATTDNITQFLEIAKVDNGLGIVYVMTQNGQDLDTLYNTFPIDRQNNAFGFLSRGNSYKIF